MRQKFIKNLSKAAKQANDKLSQNNINIRRKNSHFE